MNNTIIQEETDHIKQMSDIQLVDYINSFNISIKGLTRTLKFHHPFLYDELCNRTKFLNSFFEQHNRIVPITARLYCLEHNIHEHPHCQRQGCSNLVNWSGKEFHQHCCASCSSLDPIVKHKYEQTNMKRYGFTHALKSKEIQKKRNDTMLNRYGVEYATQSPTIMEKLKQTRIDHWGVDSFSKTQEFLDKTRQTYMHTLGVSHPLKSKQVQEKQRKTMIEHHGVPFFAQTTEYFKNRTWRYKSDKYPEITFASSWEFIVYDFLTTNEIQFEYNNGNYITYIYDNSEHRYFPDFFANGRIIEVKGDQYFRINKNTGFEEMYCPNRLPEWSDERYEWECGKAEAKHQCMLSNNVIILRKKEIENLSIDMFN